jgi:hypothetical protein
LVPKHTFARLVFLSLIAGLLVPDPPVSAQEPGANHSVLTGFVDPLDPDAEIKTDMFKQRQNEGVLVPSTVNAEHLIAAANDYRTIDQAEDFGVGESSESFLSGLVSALRDALRRVLGRPDEPKRAQVPEAWMGVYRSCDRGKSWIGGFVPGFPLDQSPASLASPLQGLNAASDPVLASAQDGYAFLGGLAFIRDGISRIFVARYRDRFDREGGACFTYELTRVVESGSPNSDEKFLDKPAIIADVPRGGSAAGNVYLAYASFSDGESKGEIRFSRSTNLGESWSVPITISTKNVLNQGTTLAVDPRNGHLYALWRDFRTNRMLYVKSVDFGQRFTAPRAIHRGFLTPFDQPTGSERFRTNGFPTLVVDGNGRLFAAWQELVNETGFPDSSGTPRIVLTMSTDGGLTWTARRAVDIALRVEEEIQRGLGDVVTRPSGPQVMPVLSVNAGQIMISFYEAREDLSADGFISGAERQMDVRAAVLDPATGNVVGASVQVSEYTVAATDPPELVETAPGYPAVHRPNLDMFQAGGASFISDYIHLSPAVPMLKTAQGWKWAASPSDVPGPSYHNTFSDNRNALFPGGDIFGDWGQYSAPGSGQLSCINPGSRNQDVYTSEISGGIVAGSPSAFKPLLQPDGEQMQRAFVVYVENRTNGPRVLDLEVFATDPGTTSVSFDQEDAVELLDEFEIFPYSTITREVFVTSTVADASARVEVRDASTGAVLARVPLNAVPPDPQFPLSNPGIGDTETHNPRISNPRISNPRISNPRISNGSPSNPRISNPRISNGSLPDGAEETTDVTFEVTNDGNTTTAFDLLTSVGNAEALLASGKYEFQLLVYRSAQGPSVGQQDPTCTPVPLTQDDVISNVANPRISNAGDPNPRISNPRISNVAFYAEPAEGVDGQNSHGDPGNEDLHSPVQVSKAFVTLRTFRTAPLAPGDPVFDPATVSATVVSQARNVFDGVIDEDPPFATFGPDPPVPLKESDGQMVPFDTPPLPAQSLAILEQPADSLAGVTLAPLVVAIVDDASQIVPQSGVAITVGFGPISAGGKLSGTTTQSTVNGVVVFSDLSIDVGGEYTLAASAGRLPLFPAVSDSFDVGSLPIITADSTGSSGPGSIRDAIETANENPGKDVITFDFAGPGPHVILLQEPLPEITEPVIIDGTSEPDFSPGAPSIVLDGSGMDNASGLVIEGDGITVRGIQIVGFDGNGIEIHGDGNVVEGCIIGTDATGTLDRGNANAGILVDGSGNRIGTDEPLPGSLLREWGSPGLGNGQLGDFPRDIEFDPVSGHLFVVDASNHRVQRFDTEGNFVLMWGRNGGDGTPGSGEGEFDGPSGLALDDAGNVYVTDENNHRVQKFRPDGTFLGQWGSEGVAPGQFDGPSGIARGRQGSSEVIYVVDHSNHRVQEFSTLGGFRRTWGRLGFGPGEFNLPNGIGVDANGAVYVAADSFNGRVAKFVPGNPCPSGTTQVTPGMCFERQWGVVGFAPREFELPNDIDLDSSGFVYVSDLRNNRYQVFDANGNLMMVRGAAGTDSGELLQTSGIAIDAGDDVYTVQQVIPSIKKFRALFADPTGLLNVIAFNRDVGVAVVSGSGNAVLGNRIYESPLSLDSGPPGSNLEAPGKPDLSESGSILQHGFTKVTGTLNSTPDTDFLLNFFFSDACTPVPEGKTFMGSAEVRTDAEGASTFAVFLPFESVGVGFASATATSPTGNTTELSPCIPHTESPRVVVTDFLDPLGTPLLDGQPIDLDLSVAGGVLPYTFRPFRAEDAQNLENGGLTLDPSGHLSGRPTGDFLSFFTLVEDSSSPKQVDVQEFAFTIVDPITITTTSLPIAVVGKPYSQFVTASGGSGTYFWDVVDDTSLPDGLVLDSSTGEIHGIATTPTDVGFAIGAFEADSDFPEQFASRDFNFLVDVIGPPARVAFVSQPTSVGVGQAFSVTVHVQDAFGTLIDNASNLISISLAAGPGTLSGITNRFAVEGSATFTGLSINAAASDYILRASASDEGIASATSAPFDVNLVQPNLIVFVTQPSNTIVGNRFSPVVQVALRNGANTVTTATNPVTLSLLTNPGGGTLAGAATVDAVAGIATFTNLRINQLTGPGTGYRLRASVPGLEPNASVLFDIDATQRVKRLNLSPLRIGNLEGGFEPILDSGANRLYLRAELSDAIGVYDTTENDIEAHIPVSGNSIRGMALDQDRDLLWIAIQLLNQVRALSTESLSFDASRQLSLDFRPIHVAVDDDGSDRIFVAGGTVAAVFDASTSPPTQVGSNITLPGGVLGSSDGFALDKANNSFYVGHAEGVTIVRGDGSFEHVNLDRPGIQMAVNSANRKLYVSTDRDVVVIDDSGSGPVVTTLTGANIIDPFGLDVNDVTGQAYVALGGTNAVLTIDGDDESFSFVTASTMQVPTRVTVDETRNLVWVTNGETSFFPSVATRIDAANANTVTGVSLPVGTNDIIVDEGKNLLYFPKGNLGYIAVASGDEPSTPISERFLATSFRGFDLSADGRLFLANIGPREIRAVEKDSLVPLDVISRFSREVAVNDVTRKLYATNLPPGKGTDDTAELLEFDLSTLGQTRSFPTPGFQANLIIDEASGLLYSLGGRVVPGDDFNQLLLIDPASGQIDDIDPGLPPQRGVFHRQTGKFYTPMVESNGNRTLGVVRGRTPALAPIALGGPFTIADLDIAEDLGRVYAGSGNRIFVIETSSDLLIDTITLSLGAPVEAIGYNPATRHLFAATFLGIEVYNVNDDANQLIATLPMGVTAFYDDVAVDPQNSLVAFSNAGDRTIVVIRDDIDLTVETFPGIRRARSAPRGGLRFDSATARLYLLDSLSGSVVSIGPLR